MSLRRSGLVAALAAAVVLAGAVPSIAAPSISAPSTRPATIEADAGGPAAAAAKLVDGMSVAEQARSIVMGHIGGTDPAALRAYMAQGFGGFILMGANMPETDAQLPSVAAALTVDPALPPLIAIDQEGGLVSRMHDDAYPASLTLKTAPPDEVGAAFGARASLIARAGVTVNYGTVADVTGDPASFIFGRALGVDPEGAAERVEAATRAQEPFVASTLKHFPGHGAAAGDSHHAIPTTDRTLAEWRRTDAVPFAAGIDAGASLLMFGHLAYPSVDPAPASLSSIWHEIAREELGFDGVMVTDDLGMLLSSGDSAYTDPVANGVAAVRAGNDLVLMIAGSTPATAGEMAVGIAAAVESGALPAERLEDAATRVMTLRMTQASATASWSECADCEPAD
jgi:beta-N-acetylhexosaminidase